jgi:hypothetical protein
MQCTQPRLAEYSNSRLAYLSESSAAWLVLTLIQAQETEGWVHDDELHPALHC